MLLGFGAGLCCSTHMIVLAFNFVRRMNFAYGVAVSGSGIGPFLFAPVMEIARETYGNRGFFFILASISIHMVLFGIVFFPSKLEKQRKHLHRRRSSVKLEIYMGQSSPKSNKCLNVLKYFKVLKNVSFFQFCLSMCFANFGISLVYVHITTFMIENNSTELQASFMLSIAGICSCFSRALAGMAANAENVDELIIYSGTFGVLGFSTILFPLYSSAFTGKLIYSCLLVSFICSLLHFLFDKNLHMLYSYTIKNICLSLALKRKHIFQEF